MTEPHTVRDYDDVVTVLKARADEVGLSTTLLDELSGLPSGYVGKLFGPARVKVMGFMAFFELVEALAMRVTIVPDLEAAQRMANRWEKREEQRRRPGIVRKRFSPEVRAKVMSEIGRLGGCVPKRFSTDEKKRTRQARRAAYARWGRTSKEDRKRYASAASKARWAKPAIIVETP